jgi:hypothetical protein
LREERSLRDYLSQQSVSLESEKQALKEDYERRLQELSLSSSEEVAAALAAKDERISHLLADQEAI